MEYDYGYVTVLSFLHNRRKDAAILESNILEYIAFNGRATQSQVAKVLNKKWPVIHDRFRKLVELGYLQELERVASHRGLNKIMFGLTSEALERFMVEPQFQDQQMKLLNTAYDPEKGFMVTVSRSALLNNAAKRWLHEQQATIVIAGGMGGRAQGLFAQNGIQVIIGAPSEDPETIVKAYLDNSLQTGENICDH